MTDKEMIEYAIVYLHEGANLADFRKGSNYNGTLSCIAAANLIASRALLNDSDQIRSYVRGLEDIPCAHCSKVFRATAAFMYDGSSDIRFGDVIMLDSD